MGIIFSFSLHSCGKTESARSDRLKAWFGGEEKLFRKADLGMTLDEVKKTEAGSPKHEDSLGLNYEIEPGAGVKGTVEYYTQPGDKKIVSIVSNLFLPTASETSALYKETENLLRERYGAPSGNFGNFTWKVAERQMEVSLRIHEGKKGLTINFSQDSNP